MLAVLDPRLRTKSYGRTSFAEPAAVPRDFGHSRIGACIPAAVASPVQVRSRNCLTQGHDLAHRGLSTQPLTGWSHQSEHRLRLWTWTLDFGLILPGQFEVMIERHFSSAHQLRGYKGKCENLHGQHKIEIDAGARVGRLNYKIEIYARGRECDDDIGLLVDFV